MRDAISYLPIVTTCVAFAFAVIVYRRYRERRGMHLLWWAIGLVTYGVGAGTEAMTTLFGWNESVFRVWYVTSALLSGAPLAQGTAYLFMPRETANRLAIAVLTVVAFGAVVLFASPIDYASVQPYRLSGRVLEWPWVRLVSPFVNAYALVLLVGGAVASAARYMHQWGTRNRVIANVCIAIGGVLPGIGGSITRMGHIDVLYVTELAGLLLIYAGYRASLRAGIPSRMLFAPGRVTASTIVLVR